jgi:hypothetical protein
MYFITVSGPASMTVTLYTGSSLLATYTLFMVALYVIAHGQ